MIPARASVHKLIEDLTAGEIYRLSAYHPRLRAKFAQIVREEYDDGNILFGDIETVLEMDHKRRLR